MAKININDQILDVDLDDIESENDVSNYDLSIYSQTNKFLEEILSFEYIFEESNHIEEKLKGIKQYLKILHWFKRKINVKIKSLLDYREDLNKKI